MKSICDRRLEFLEDTIKYYSEDTSRRAVVRYDKNSSIRCRYKTADGRKCAIGRHIPEGKYKKQFDSFGSSIMDVFRVLPNEIQELGCDFLIAIQNLHDKDKYWCNNGLTTEGKKRKRYLRDEVKRNSF